MKKKYAPINIAIRAWSYAICTVAISVTRNAVAATIMAVSFAPSVKEAESVSEAASIRVANNAGVRAKGRISARSQRAAEESIAGCVNAMADRSPAQDATAKVE